MSWPAWTTCYRTSTMFIKIQPAPTSLAIPPPTRDHPSFVFRCPETNVYHIKSLAAFLCLCLISLLLSCRCDSCTLSSSFLQLQRFSLSPWHMEPLNLCRRNLGFRRAGQPKRLRDRPSHCSSTPIEGAVVASVIALLSTPRGQLSEPYARGSASSWAISLLPIGRGQSGPPNGARRWCEEGPPSLSGWAPASVSGCGRQGGRWAAEYRRASGPQLCVSPVPPRTHDATRLGSSAARPRNSTSPTL